MYIAECTSYFTAQSILATLLVRSRTSLKAMMLVVWPFWTLSTHSLPVHPPHLPLVKLTWSKNTFRESNPTIGNLQQRFSDMWMLMFEILPITRPRQLEDFHSSHGSDTSFGYSSTFPSPNHLVKFSCFATVALVSARRSGDRNHACLVENLLAEVACPCPK